MLAFLMLAENPLEHIVRHPMIQRPAHLGWLTQGGKITLLDSHIVMMMLAALLLILLVPLSVRRRRGTGEVDVTGADRFRQRRRGDLRISAQGGRAARPAAATPTGSSSSSGPSSSSS